MATIILLVGDIASKALPPGNLKQNIELAIALAEYIIGDIIYDRSPYIIGVGTAFLLFLLFTPEGKSTNEDGS